MRQKVKFYYYSREIKGMVTLGNVMAKIMAGKVMSTSKVSDILYTTFHKVHNYALFYLYIYLHF